MWTCHPASGHSVDTGSVNNPGFLYPNGSCTIKITNVGIYLREFQLQKATSPHRHWFAGVPKLTGDPDSRQLDSLKTSYAS